jgi:predicted nucleic acid-binding protein
MRIYLDTCCYNRPFDDFSHERVHLESEAVLALIKKVNQGMDEIVGSDILELEISRIANIDKLKKVRSLYNVATMNVPYSEQVLARSKEIQEMANIRSFDALHIASAEKARADVMLTTDDRLERSCMGIQLSVKVTNPIKFFMEVMNYDK